MTTKEELELLEKFKKATGLKEWDRNNYDTDDRIILDIIRQVLKDKEEE